MRVLQFEMEAKAQSQRELATEQKSREQMQEQLGLARVEQAAMESKLQQKQTQEQELEEFIEGLEMRVSKQSNELKKQKKERKSEQEQLILQGRRKTAEAEKRAAALAERIALLDAEVDSLTQLKEKNKERQKEAAKRLRSEKKVREQLDLQAQAERQRLAEANALVKELQEQLDKCRKGLHLEEEQRKEVERALGLALDAKNKIETQLDIQLRAKQQHEAAMVSAREEATVCARSLAGTKAALQRARHEAERILQMQAQEQEQTLEELAKSVHALEAQGQAMSDQALTAARSQEDAAHRAKQLEEACAKAEQKLNIEIEAKEKLVQRLAESVALCAQTEQQKQEETGAKEKLHARFEAQQQALHHQSIEVAHARDETAACSASLKDAKCDLQHARTEAERVLTAETEARRKNEKELHDATERIHVLDDLVAQSKLALKVRGCRRAAPLIKNLPVLTYFQKRRKLRPDNIKKITVKS